RNWPNRPGDRSIQCGAVLSVSGQQADGGLAAKERRREHIARSEKSDIRTGADIRVDTGVERRVELADGDLLGERRVASCRNVCVIVDRSKRPAGLLWGCRHAAEKSRHPEADAIFIGEGNARRGDCDSDGERDGNKGRDERRYKTQWAG